MKILDVIEKIKLKQSIDYNFNLQHGYPRIWLDKDFLHYDKTLCSPLYANVNSHKLTFKREAFDLKVTSPEFELSYNSHGTPRFKNQVIIEFDDYSGEYTEVIPTNLKPVEIGRLFDGGNEFFNWRFSDSGSIMSPKYRTGV
jgi:hypothetical protein